MKISIVIPVYNVASFIGDCIRSVIGQSWQGPLECVFVDDCGWRLYVAWLRLIVEVLSLRL